MEGRGVSLTLLLAFKLGVVLGLGVLCGVEVFGVSDVASHALVHARENAGIAVSVVARVHGLDHALDLDLVVLHHDGLLVNPSCAN